MSSGVHIKVEGEKKGNKGKAALEPIIGVSKAEVEAAGEQIKAEGEAKRARSSMMSYLIARGQQDAYAAQPLPLRKQFMIQHYAMKLKDKKTNKTMTSGRKTVVENAELKKEDFYNKF